MAATSSLVPERSGDSSPPVPTDEPPVPSSIVTSTHSSSSSSAAATGARKPGSSLKPPKMGGLRISSTADRLKTQSTSALADIGGATPRTAGMLKMKNMSNYLKSAPSSIVSKRMSIPSLHAANQILMDLMEEQKHRERLAGEFGVINEEPGSEDDEIGMDSSESIFSYGSDEAVRSGSGSGSDSIRAKSKKGDEDMDDEDDDGPLGVIAGLGRNFRGERTGRDVAVERISVSDSSVAAPQRSSAKGTGRIEIALPLSIGRRSLSHGGRISSSSTTTTTTGHVRGLTLEGDCYYGSSSDDDSSSNHESGSDIYYPSDAATVGSTARMKPAKPRKHRHRRVMKRPLSARTTQSMKKSSSNSFFEAQKLTRRSGGDPLYSPRRSPASPHTFGSSSSSKMMARPLDLTSSQLPQSGPSSLKKYASTDTFGSSVSGSSSLAAASAAHSRLVPPPSAGSAYAVDSAIHGTRAADPSGAALLAAEFAEGESERLERLEAARQCSHVAEELLATEESYLSQMIAMEKYLLQPILNGECSLHFWKLKQAAKSKGKSSKSKKKTASSSKSASSLLAAKAAAVQSSAVSPEQAVDEPVFLETDLVMHGFYKFVLEIIQVSGHFVRRLKVSIRGTSDSLRGSTTPVGSAVGGGVSADSLTVDSMSGAGGGPPLSSSSAISRTALSGQHLAMIGQNCYFHSKSIGVYAHYAQMYDILMDRLNYALRSNLAFVKWLKKQEKRYKEELRSMPLTSLLILPVQRLPRYLLLLTDLIKYSIRLEIDPIFLNLANEEISNVSSRVNEMIRLRENRDSLRQLKKRFVGKLKESLVRSNRVLIHEGFLLKVRKSRIKYYFHLFNDILVYSDLTKSSHYEIHRIIDLHHCAVRDLSDIFIDQSGRIVSGLVTSAVSAGALTSSVPPSSGFRSRSHTNSEDVFVVDPMPRRTKSLRVKSSTVTSPIEAGTVTVTKEDGRIEDISDKGRSSSKPRLSLKGALKSSTETSKSSNGICYYRFLIQTPDKSFEVYVTTKDEKQTWLYLIQAAIQRLKPDSDDTYTPGDVTRGSIGGAPIAASSSSKKRRSLIEEVEMGPLVERVGGSDGSEDLSDAMGGFPDVLAPVHSTVTSPATTPGASTSGLSGKSYPLPSYLVDSNPLEYAPRWIHDEECPNCAICDKKFGLTLRRKQCGQCGRVVCHGCSKHRRRVKRAAGVSGSFAASEKDGKSSVKPVRVCDACIDSGILDDMDDLLSRPVSPLELSAAHSNSSDSDGGLEEGKGTTRDSSMMTSTSESRTKTLTITRTHNLSTVLSKPSLDAGTAGPSGFGLRSTSVPALLQQQKQQQPSKTTKTVSRTYKRRVSDAKSTTTPRKRKASLQRFSLSTSTTAIVDELRMNNCDEQNSEELPLHLHILSFVREYSHKVQLLLEVFVRPLMDFIHNNDWFHLQNQAAAASASSSSSSSTLSASTKKSGGSSKRRSSGGSHSGRMTPGSSILDITSVKSSTEKAEIKEQKLVLSQLEKAGQLRFSALISLYILEQIMDLLLIFYSELKLIILKNASQKSSADGGGGYFSDSDDTEWTLQVESSSTKKTSTKKGRKRKGSKFEDESLYSSDDFDDRDYARIGRLFRAHYQFFNLHVDYAAHFSEALHVFRVDGPMSSFIKDCRIPESLLQQLIPAPSSAADPSPMASSSVAKAGGGSSSSTTTTTPTGGRASPKAWVSRTSSIRMLSVDHQGSPHFGATSSPIISSFGDPSATTVSAGVGSGSGGVGGAAGSVAALTSFDVILELMQSPLEFISEMKNFISEISELVDIYSVDSRDLMLSLDTMIQTETDALREFNQGLSRVTMFKLGEKDFLNADLFRRSRSFLIDGELEVSMNANPRDEDATAMTSKTTSASSGKRTPKAKKKAALTMSSPRRKVHCYLFSDVLVLSNKKKIERVFPLRNITVVDSPVVKSAQKTKKKRSFALPFTKKLISVELRYECEFKDDLTSLDTPRLERWLLELCSDSAKTISLWKSLLCNFVESEKKKSKVLSSSMMNGSSFGGSSSVSVGRRKGSATFDYSKRRSGLSILSSGDEGDSPEAGSGGASTSSGVAGMVSGTRSSSPHWLRERRRVHSTSLLLTSVGGGGLLSDPSFDSGDESSEDTTGGTPRSGGNSPVVYGGLGGSTSVGFGLSRSSMSTLAVPGLLGVSKKDGSRHSGSGDRDEDSRFCTLCHSEFNFLTKRRRRCYVCESAVCDSCSAAGFAMNFAGNERFDGGDCRTVTKADVVPAPAHLKMCWRCYLHSATVRSSLRLCV